MKCFFCNDQACAKVGVSKSNFWLMLFGKTALSKKEVYLCKRHFEEVNSDKIELMKKIRKD